MQTYKEMKKRAYKNMLNMSKTIAGNLYENSTPFYGTLNRKRFSLQMTVYHATTPHQNTSDQKHLNCKKNMNDSRIII